MYHSPASLTRSPLPSDIIDATLARIVPHQVSGRVEFTLQYASMLFLGTFLTVSFVTTTGLYHTREVHQRYGMS